MHQGILLKFHLVLEGSLMYSYGTGQKFHVCIRYKKIVFTWYWKEVSCVHPVLQNNFYLVLEIFHVLIR